MNRRISFVAIIVVVCCGLVGVSAHDEFGFVGTVVAMDTSKNTLTITIREDNKNVTLKIAMTAKTPVAKDGRKVSRADLKRGVYVVVSALGHDYDDLEAVSVKIVPPPAK